MNIQEIPKLKHINSNNFFLLAGPCAIEGEDMALRIAEKVVSITNKLEIPYVFKGSFKKANRSRIDSFTGIGDEKALKILGKVSDTFDVPTVTDIHEVSDAVFAAQYPMQKRFDLFIRALSLLSASGLGIKGETLRD